MLAPYQALTLGSPEEWACTLDYSGSPEEWACTSLLRRRGHQGAEGLRDAHEWAQLALREASQESSPPRREGMWLSKYLMSESTKEPRKEMGRTPSPCICDPLLSAHHQATFRELLCSSHTSGAAGCTKSMPGGAGIKLSTITSLLCRCEI